jgi:Ca2+-transporting ATPase
MACRLSRSRPRVHGDAQTPEPSIAYRQRVDELIAALQADQQQGLTSDDAQARLERFGSNELAAEQPIAAWRRFLSQFQDVLVILLLIATAVSAGLWVYEREAALPYEAIA